MRKAVVVVLAGCALFWAGRLLFSAEGPKRNSDAARGHDAQRRDEAAVGQLASKLRVALDEMQRRAQSQMAREALNTVQEPAAHWEARRKYVSSELDRLYPSLPPAKRGQMLALGDRTEAEFRQYRAGFMVGSITEDEYVAGLKQAVRRGVEDAKTLFTRDEFEVLVGNPDYDPFDPRAHSVPGRPPYLTRDEAAAIKNSPESASIASPDLAVRTPH